MHTSRCKLTETALELESTVRPMPLTTCPCCSRSCGAYAIDINPAGDCIAVGDRNGGLQLWPLELEAVRDEWGLAGLKLVACRPEAEIQVCSVWGLWTAWFSLVCHATLGNLGSLVSS